MLRSIIPKKQNQFKFVKYFSTSNTKTYQEILGLSKDASVDEIKSSYRELAKKCHPDLQKDNALIDPLVNDKFKEITEAYSVLSNTKTRLNQDVSIMKSPETLFKDLKEVEEEMFKRGPDGHIQKDAPVKESQEAQRQKQVEAMRKDQNVDKFGRQKGGVPSGQQFRGKGAGQPGMKHNVHVHNQFHNMHPDAYFLTETDANMFKQQMSWDRDLFKKRMKYNIPLEEDTGLTIRKTAWSMIPVVGLAAFVLYSMFFASHIDPKKNLDTQMNYKKIRNHQIQNGDDTQLIPLSRPYQAEI